MRDVAAQSNERSVDQPRSGTWKTSVGSCHGVAEGKWWRYRSDSIARVLDSVCSMIADCACVHPVHTAHTGGQLASSASSGQDSTHTDANAMPPSSCRARSARSVNERLRRDIRRALYHMREATTTSARPLFPHGSSRFWVPGDPRSSSGFGRVRRKQMRSPRIPRNCLQELLHQGIALACGRDARTPSPHSPPRPGSTGLSSSGRSAATGLRATSGYISTTPMMIATPM